MKKVKKWETNTSALDIAQYLLSLDPNRKFFTKRYGNFRLNSLLHISQILYYAKYQKPLFKEDLIAYPPGWYKLSLQKQKKLTEIMNDKAVKNQGEILLKLYQKVKLEEQDRKLLHNCCRSFTG